MVMMLSPAGNRWHAALSGVVSLDMRKRAYLLQWCCAASCVGKRTILETLWFHSPIDSGDEIPGEITDGPHEGAPAFMLLIHEIPPHAKDSR